MKYEYTTLRRDTAESIDRAMNRLAVTGYVMEYFKYHEYPVNVKGEGTTIMQSYVAIMKKPVDNNSCDRPLTD